MESYKIPALTRIGHVHLKVSDLKRSLDFYQGLLGFEITTMYGENAAFISAGGYHHHIGLNTWYSSGMPPASANSAYSGESLPAFRDERLPLIPDETLPGATGLEHFKRV